MVVTENNKTKEEEGLLGTGGLKGSTVCGCGKQTRGTDFLRFLGPNTILARCQVLLGKLGSNSYYWGEEQERQTST